LVETGIFPWDEAQMGWLMAAPVLTGSIFRLPVGILTDKFGGRRVYTLTMLAAAAGALLLSFAQDFTGYLLASLVFGLAGAGFAVGIAYTAIWFKREHQGTALGIFGVGNAGSAVTSFGAPLLLTYVTRGGESLDSWRLVPQIYAVGLVLMAIGFFMLTFHKVVERDKQTGWVASLQPLRNVRVWRFGLYYFFVFGGFVALAQWLIPYYVNVYGTSIVLAGLLATVFNLPSGVIRALGGWLSDLVGARQIMQWVFILSLVCSALLVFPRMEVYSPGGGAMATRGGVVTSVGADHVVVDTKRYALHARKARAGAEATDPRLDTRTLIWPTFESWQEPVVAVGDRVARKQLLARGLTHVYFQANIWVFTFLVFLLGIAMGIGKAGVYKYIPDYFPRDVGVVGGMVGVIGGLGGFFCPVVFGYLLKATGIWTTCWGFLAVVVIACMAWMHHVVSRIQRASAGPHHEKWEFDNGSAHAH
jgi:NNP family nitrate/nitrite transporter-like MFS transporter